MSAPDAAYVSRLETAVLETAVLEAVMETSIEEVDGLRIAVVRNHEVFEALTRTIVALCMLNGVTGPARPADLKKLFGRRVDAAFREAQSARVRTH